jgi:nucleotide-binding universal stress UspA family protein
VRAYAGQEEDDSPASRQAREMLRRQVKRIEQAGGRVAGSHLRRGDAAEQIVRLSEDLDAGTIVIGSKGMSAITRLVMGSVSERVVRYAHCPVYVIRGE